MDEQEHEPQIKGEHREQVIEPAKASIAGHNWQQFGPMLICRSCPFEHSQSIPPNLIYRGLDKQGYPILEKV